MSECQVGTALQIEQKSKHRMRSPVDVKLQSIASTLEKSNQPVTIRSPILQSFVSAISNSNAFWLVLYFVFNLGLTLFNKSVLMSFPFPYTLTASHALCGSVGGYVLSQNGAVVKSNLGPKDTAALVAFSVLYSVNILVSNVSLHLVTVPVSLG